MAGIIFGIIVGVVLLLVIWYLISNEFYKAAEKKGHPQKKYLWLTFFFGMVGILLVIALPDRGQVSAQIEAQLSDELPEL